MEKLITNISEKWLDGDSILHVKYVAGSTIDLPAIIQSRTDNEKLFNHKKELVLCDARVSFTITPDAQKYARMEIMNKSRIATAVLTNKAYVQLVVNFALRFSKLKSVVKMFCKEQDALKWLRSFNQN